jgi:hypothetical protein
MLSEQRVFIAISAYAAAEQGAKGGSYYCYYLFTAWVAQLFTLRRVVAAPLLATAARAFISFGS